VVLVNQAVDDVTATKQKRDAYENRNQKRHMTSPIRCVRARSNNFLALQMVSELLVPV